MPSDSARYDEATNVRPKGTCKSMTGSVIDIRNKYPSTHEFASSPSENSNKVSEGSKSRRPGGSMRRGHPFGCSCGEHPCRCGTSEAKSHIVHDNVNE